MPYNNMDSGDVITSRYSHLGTAVRKDLQAQNQALEKQAQLNGVSSQALALKVLQNNKGNLLKFLATQGVQPVSDNPATLATQIAGIIAGGINKIQNGYDFEGREYSFYDAFDEYFADQLNEEFTNPYSVLHYSNNPGEMFGADGDGTGGEAVGQGLENISGAASAIPVVGSILGPILKIGGGIINGIGKKKHAKAEAIKKQKEQEEAARQQALLKMKEGPLGPEAGKKKMLLIGGAVVILIILVLVLTGKK
jgi:hypothetical protein